MFEGLVRQLLLGYLGQYIRDIQNEQLKITLWNEEVLLENVELILEAFDYLQFPFALKQGHVGKLSIRIPWKKLGWDPVIIILEDVLICASQRDEKEWSMDAVERREFAGKKAKLAAAELAKLSRRVCDSQSGKSFISHIAAKILDSIQVSIRNMHVLYRDMLTTSAVTVFGLKFSSLTIMKQPFPGSSSGKVRGSQVNKIVEVQGLELYCNTFQGSDKLMSVDIAVGSKIWEGALSQANEKVNLLAPLDVSLSLSVNRSGGLDSSAPQYSINVELNKVLINVDEVQIQQFLSFCDYMLTSQLREKYGRYRPWWSPMDKKLKGWQIAWWHYAQQSVRMDVRKRLRKTSWKFLGERLNCRRKYVNLYKTKLKFLHQDQVIAEDVMQMLEEIEKESDIDEILSYRFVAERELQDVLLASSSNSVHTGKSLEDERPFSKPRGWLNWLSHGVLGAGGTDGSSQFSGIISDDVIKDIYEATKFQPVQSLNADAAASAKVCISSIKFSINQLSVALQSMKLGCAIAHLVLNEISIECETWEEEAVISARISSGEMLNPVNKELILFMRMNHDESTFDIPQPFVNIHVDVSSPQRDANLSVKAIIQPLEVTYDAEFVKNILALLYVVDEFKSLNYRILLSMNGIDNIKPRLLSKVDYILSSRKKITWDANFAAVVINFPWKSANSEVHKLVFEVGELSFVSKYGQGSFTVTSDFSDDFLEGYLLQDFYDHFKINISNFQVDLLTSYSSVPLPLLEKFNGSVALSVCIIPDESILKRLEVGMEVSSVLAHISLSLCASVTELITDFVLPHLTSVSSVSNMVNNKSSGLAPSNCFWLSAHANVESVAFLIDLENDAGSPCSLMLSFQELDIRFVKNKFAECWTSIKALDIKCNSSQIEGKDNVLCSSRSFLTEPFGQYDIGTRTCHQIGNPSNKHFVGEQFFFLHYKTCKSLELIRHEYEVCLTGLDVHCYPFIIGHLTGFFDKIFEHNDKASTGVDSNEKSNSQPTVSNSSCPQINVVMMYFINLDYGGLRIHFHDSCSIVGSVSLPNARSVLSIGENNLDVLCSTEGFLLSSSWWPQQIHDFLWGPLTPTHPPILNLHVRKETSKSQKSLLEMSFCIQHVSCVLPPEFLAVIIGYFLLPDWSPSLNKPPIVENSEHIDLLGNAPVTYKFEILDSNLYVPVRLDGYQYVKLDIPQLCGSFIENVDLESALKNVPSECLVKADEVAQGNQCLYLSGRDLSLSLFLIKDMLDCSGSTHIPRRMLITLISPLTAELWVTIPSQCEPPKVLASCPTSIMAMVNYCQLTAKGDSIVVGYEALVDGINQFSMIEKQSKEYKSNIYQFLEFKEGLGEDYASPPESAANVMILRACVKSMSLRLCRTKGDSVASDVIAEANSQFTCSASFRNDELQCLKISFSTLSLFSLLNSVMLAECPSASTVSVLDLTYLISEENGSILLLSIPSVDVWLHTSDWGELVNLVQSCVQEHPAIHTLSSSPENITFVFGDEIENEAIDTLSNSNRLPNSSTCSGSENVKPSTVFPRVQLEIVGTTVHIPVWVRKDAFNIFEGNQNDHLDDLRNMIYGNQHGFVAVKLQRGTAKVVIDEKGMGLELSLNQTKGSVELRGEDKLHTSPLFQLFQVNLDAEISSSLVNGIHGKLDIRCDSLDVWLSNHIFYFWCFVHFQNQSAGTSQFIINCMDSKVHLKKLSLFLTNGKWSSTGPLMEFLIQSLLLHSSLNAKEIQVSVVGDIQAYYNNIDKVLWEPFIEPWGFQLCLSRIHDKTSLLSTEAATEIRLESTSQLKLNITESLVEVASRMIEVIRDAWDTAEMKTSSENFSSRLNVNLDGRRHAPYVLQNLTSLPLVFYVYKGQHASSNLGVSLTKSGKLLQPGFSIPIDVEETPEKHLHYNYAQTSDKLSDGQSVEAAHHYISIQFEGTSMPSGPISMDLVGLRYFEVDFSKSSSKSDAVTNGDASKIFKKIEREASTGSETGFVVPVVIDVSIQPYTKMVQLYSTVLLSNATSAPLEVRLDIPFSVSPKILDPIYPGQQCPLPLHLAEAGRVRWRPLGNAYLWSEAYNIQNILSHESRISILRSFVCYPSHPSSDPFRCCISVHDWCLPSVGLTKMGALQSNSDALRPSSEIRNELSHDMVRSKKRYVHQLTLSSPLVLKNYLPEAVSITIENGGVTSSAMLSEVENSFFHIDSSHDLTITFQLHGFNPSAMKFPRAETFVETAKFSGTRFFLWETITFDSISSSGPLCVTFEKVMDAFSGAREICISVPFLLYNCTGLSLFVSNAVNGTKGHCCIVPSCYDFDKQDLVPSKKDGLGLLSPIIDSDIAPYDNSFPISSLNSYPIINSNDNRLSEKHSRAYHSSTVVHRYSHNHGLYTQKSSSTFKNQSGSSSQSSLRSSDFLENDSDKINCCMYSPDSSFSSDKIVVKVSRFLSPCVTHNPPNSWSNAFSLVPPTGSTSVVVPQPSKSSGYVMSVSAVAAPFSGRTKIITFQPRYVISNACNKDLCYRQKGTDVVFLLEAGQHSHIQWTDTTRELLVSIRFVEPGWQWSGCFLPEHLGDTQVKMRNFVSGAVNMIRVEVQSADFCIRDEKIVGSPRGNSGTNLVLLSDDDTGFMPYRIDNFSKERLRVYQQRCEAFETMIHSYSSCPYAWDEPCYPHRLTIEVPGERVIGSYTLDDVKDYIPVCLSATSEKPERTLLVSVCSEGATKVLRIIDSSCHDLNDTKSTCVPQLKDKGKHARKPVSVAHFKERIVVNIPFVGISLINSIPEELLFACARNITMDFVQSLDQQKLSLQIMSLQIDNQLPNTPYPVILSFDHNIGVTSRDTRETAIGTQEPAFSVVVAKWRNKYLSLVSFEYISLRVADLHLELDQEVILSLFEFIKSVSSRLQSRVLQHMNPTLHPIFSDLESDLSVHSCSLDFEPLNSNSKQHFASNITLFHESSKNSLLPPIIPIGAPWQQIHLLARKQKKIYVEFLDMSSIKLTLSFSSSPWMLRNGVLTSGESLVHRGLMALADVEGAQIHLKHLILSHQLASWESIQEILIGHYSRQFLHEMYKVLGSAGVIGNPMGFARSVTLGIKDFLSAPLQSVFQSRAGLIKGMAQGTSSLLSNTVYAISDTATQFSKAAQKGIVAFTFDGHSIANMDRPQKGISSQSKGVINEFLEGLTGLLQSPIKGAEKHGLPGVVSGIALGVTGLVAKPTASVLDITGKTAQSIRNWSKSGYHRFRVRLPRHLSREYPLRPYSWEEAIGTSVLQEAAEGDEVLVICNALKEEGKFVIITERLVLVVSSKSLENLGKPEFRGVPANLEWVTEMEIGMDSIIHADNDGEMVHIVGSSRSDVVLRQQKRGWNNNNHNNNPRALPLFQTDLLFTSKERATEFLHTLLSAINQAKQQGRCHVHLLHQSSLR